MRSKSRGFFADLHKPAALRLFLHIMICCGLLEVLREDNRAIVRAASQASRAANFLLEFLPGLAAGPTTVVVDEGDVDRQLEGRVREQAGFCGAPKAERVVRLPGMEI